MTTRMMFGHAAGWFFGVLFFTIGFINCFWGNDAGFGIFISLLSFMYLPPVTDAIQEKTGIKTPVWLKMITGVFIIWAAAGVGELPAKIDMMLMDF